MSYWDHFWDRHYSRGGSSGPGSISHIGKWKWGIIEAHTDYQNVADYGCGDLSFWTGRVSRKYTGIDRSSVILEKNKIARPMWTFISALDQDVIDKIKAVDVFCFDVLFHIMEDSEYKRVLDNLFSIAQRRVFIYTWRVNPFSRSVAFKQTIKKLLKLRLGDAKGWFKYVISPTDSDGIYQKYRSLETLGDRAEFNVIKYPSPDGIGVLLVYIKKTF